MEYVGPVDGQLCSAATKQMKRQNAELTIASIRAGDCTGASPEFGRVQDLARNFGIKRGTAYNLLAQGKIRGCLLRVRGQKSGVRLFDLDSVRAFIRSEMERAEAVGDGTRNQGGAQ